MIEKTVLDYLNSHPKIECPVYMEEPEDVPEEYLLIERTSGGSKDLIDNCTIAIQSYSSSLYKACRLNNIAKKAMLNITVLPDVSESKLNSDYNFTDTKRKKYRYQAVFDLTYMEVEDE